MTFTLAWKELREHQGIWLTMVCMTIGLGLGLAKVVSLNDASMAVPVAAFTILGMAATYGIVCGSMMFAGEHEGGTLVFLDIFLGRRGLLWVGKFAIGVVLVMAQALCVALILGLLDQQAPIWTMALIGQFIERLAVGEAPAGASVWCLILPVVTLEAFAWGMLGSSLTRRVLAGAAIAAVGFTPVWLLAITVPGPVFFPFRLMLALGLLAVSRATFVNQSREAANAPPPAPETPIDPKEKFLRQWDRYEHNDEILVAQLVEEAPVRVPETARPAAANDHGANRRAARVARSFEEEPEQAESPREVLWWLTTQQAGPIFWSLIAASVVLGFILIPINVQVLWPVATLLIGVVCGVSAFAPEQRDLSYQFLAAQHFPMKVIWRFKIGYWLAVALIVTMSLFLGSLLMGRFSLLGTLTDQMGLTLFYAGWLFYGFCVGQLFVWLCRKTILALLVSVMVATASIGMWLPSLVCGGMSGWQVWLPPLTMLAASGCLMRAWTGGRIWERKPIMALSGFGAAIGVWALMNFGYRAWEIPDVGAPLDIAAFRASLPSNKGNEAAKAIHKGIALFDEAQTQKEKLANVVRRPGRVKFAVDRMEQEVAQEKALLAAMEARWVEAMAEAARLPVGVLEMPRSDGQSAQLKHLPTCQKMAFELQLRARTADPDPAFDYLAQILALSRNLRNKAPLVSYLAGIDAEEKAMEGLDHWLDRGKPDPLLLRHVLDEMNRHATETPPPLDCLHTECYRSGGLLDYPNAWSFSARRGDGRVPEQWMVGGIALSMEMPWEAERKTRLWQLAWAGLFRAVDTPHWQRPKFVPDPHMDKLATRNVLQGWLAATEGVGSSVTRARMVLWLDNSWLADERLFCSATLLRDKATRARWHVDGMRQVIALALYRLEEGSLPRDLERLVPKYLPAGLPTDPYSGQPYHYRVRPEDEWSMIWSTGPDGIDHGGRHHGGQLTDDDTQWQTGGFDLMTFVPRWRK